MKQIFLYDKNEHLITCKIIDHNQEFIGIAKCCPDDYDMENDRTGEQIAAQRALIALTKHIRDNELKPGLAALMHLYSTMYRSKNFNKKSYEAKRLQKSIQQFEKELSAINKDLTTLRKNLSDYIAKKDEFYKAIRKNREKDKHPERFVTFAAPGAANAKKKKKRTKNKLVKNK